MLPAGAGSELRTFRVSQPSVVFSRVIPLSSLVLNPRAREGQRRWSSSLAVVSFSHGCSSCDPFRLRDSVGGSRGGRFDIEGSSCSRYRLDIGPGSSPRRPMSAEAAAEHRESSLLSLPVSSSSAMNGTVIMNGGLGLSPDRARSGAEVSGRTSSSMDAEERWRVNGSAEACVATILVTGGAGYIGSHTCVQLLEEGYRVVVVDNLDNSSEEAVRRVAELAGSRGENLTFFKVDLCDRQTLEELFTFVRFDAVIHFAGLKAVGESVRMPLRYYRNNIEGTLNLAELMAAHNCKKMVFSSSATVYGQPQHVPCREDDTMQTLNPYARTKLYIENIMRDVQVSDPEWRIVLLRYFNPVAAHPSGRIGEDPRGIPNNLMPFIQQVAVGRRPFLSVFGSDYPTRDGTGVRDFVHVMDLASGHTAALRKIFRTRDVGCEVYNLGTGRGTSVLEMVAAFEKASGVKLTVKLCPRRDGDAGEVFAATAKAEKELDWKAKYNVDDMCRDQWNWAKNNPWGYARGPEEEEEVEDDERSGGRGPLEQRQFGEANVDLGRLGHSHAHEYGSEDERVRCMMTANRVSLVSLGSMEEES